MGEDELICDLAETYGIYDYKALSPSLVATLTIGLRDDSRIKMKLTGQKRSLEQMLLALIFDDLNLILWSRKGKHRGRRPDSVFKRLTENRHKDELKSFATPEEFEAWMERKRKGWKHV